MFHTAASMFIVPSYDQAIKSALTVIDGMPRYIIKYLLIVIDVCRYVTITRLVTMPLK